MSLVKVPGFADRAERTAVIAAYERRRRLPGSGIGDEDWDGRAMWIGTVHGGEGRTRKILERWRQRATALASLVAKRVLFSDAILVVRWDGEAMAPHRDHRFADGTPNRTPWREWAGVIYLNDDYIGGALTFPESGETYRPVAGTLVMFPATHLHGVEPAANGPRYTSPLWFTGDPAHVDMMAMMSANA